MPTAWPAADIASSIGMSSCRPSNRASLPPFPSSGCLCWGAPQNSRLSLCHQQTYACGREKGAPDMGFQSSKQQWTAQTSRCVKLLNHSEELPEQNAHRTTLLLYLRVPQTSMIDVILRGTGWTKNPRKIISLFPGTCNNLGVPSKPTGEHRTNTVFSAHGRSPGEQRTSSSTTSVLGALSNTAAWAAAVRRWASPWASGCQWRISSGVSVGPLVGSNKSVLLYFCFGSLYSK